MQKNPNNQFIFCGYDQAVVNTGISILGWDGQSDNLNYIYSELFSSKFKWGLKSDVYILLEQSAHLKKIINKYSKIAPILASCIEGVSYGSPGGASSRGSIWGLFVSTCIRQADVIVAPPLSLKMFVTGHGKADKKDILNIMIPKYGLDKLGRKIWDDEADSLGLAEIGYWSWRIMNEGIDKIKDKLKPHELKVLWNEQLNANKQPKGICHRLEDLYLKRIN